MYKLLLVFHWTDIHIFVLTITLSVVHDKNGEVVWWVGFQSNRVQIRQTSKLVVVQRCGLTNDRQTAPRPPAPDQTLQSQYLWTLKMGVYRISLQDWSRTWDTQDSESDRDEQSRKTALEVGGGGGTRTKFDEWSEGGEWRVTWTRLVGRGE